MYKLDIPQREMNKVVSMKTGQRERRDQLVQLLLRNLELSKEILNWKKEGIRRRALKV